MNPLFTYFGSKWRLASKIISTFPSHNKYIEPYGGTGIILFNKEKVDHQIFNDIDFNIYNFFNLLKNNSDDLINNIESYSYSRLTFEWSKEQDIIDDNLEIATKWYWNNQLSYGGRGISYCDHYKNINRSKTRLDNLYCFADFLQNVEITNLTAIELIQKEAIKDTLLYVDPPYCIEGKEYEYGMSRYDHIKLLEILRETPAKVVLSSYNNQLYNSLLQEWDIIELNAQVSFGVSRDNRKEVLWTNCYLEL